MAEKDRISLQEIFDNLYNKELNPGGVEANLANSFSKLRPDGTKVVVHFSLVNEILDNYGLEKTQLGAWENEAENVLDIILDTQYKILEDKGIQESPRGFFGGNYTSVSPEEFKQIIPKLNNYFLGKEVLLDSEDYLDESGEGLKLKYKGNPIVPIDTPANVVDDINKIGTLDYPNQWHNTPTVKLVEAISENNLDIFVKNSKGEFVKLELNDTARIGENAIQNSPKFDEGKLAIYSAIEELGDVDNPRYKLDLYSSNPDELAKLKKALSNVNFDPFVNPKGTPFQLLPDTPTNVVDLDEVISQSDGVDNLNKSKEIMQKNPGFFRKVFNVLEKLDIGDQVITKAIAKGLPALGLASAAPGAAIAYGAYEISILLTDAAQAYNKMQTTDEGFWENFGELSDKYSIAYKISKPVYDIILDSLNDDLTTEGQDEEILFSFNR